MTDYKALADAQAAEIARLRYALQREADWHDAEAKAHRGLQKSGTGVFHGLRGEWHQDHAQQLRAALSGENNV